MRLLKAFIRTDKVDEVIRALKAAKAPGLTVSRVHGVGYGYDPLFTMSTRELPKTQEVAKVEVVCCAEEVDRLLATLMEGARTGSRGDGIVFVTPVDQAVRIRTGEAGRVALSS